MLLLVDWIVHHADSIKDLDWRYEIGRCDRVESSLACHAPARESFMVDRFSSKAFGSRRKAAAWSIPVSLAKAELKHLSNELIRAREQPVRISWQDTQTKHSNIPTSCRCQRT